MRKRGTQKYYVYTTPSKKAIQSIKDKAKVMTYRSTRHQNLDELLRDMNQTMAGWANYFRYGVSKAVFGAVDYHAWGRLMRWIRAKYAGKRNRLGMAEFRRRFCDRGWRIAHNGVVFTGASSVAVTRYRYCGSTISTPCRRTAWCAEPRTGKRAEPGRVSGPQGARGRGSSAGGGDAAFDADEAVLQPVAGPVDSDDLAVVQEAVEDRGGQHFVAEDLSPLAEAFV
jgi:hypothetical protein